MQERSANGVRIRDMVTSGVTIKDMLRQHSPFAPRRKGVWPLRYTEVPKIPPVPNPNLYFDNVNLHHLSQDDQHYVATATAEDVHYLIRDGEILLREQDTTLIVSGHTPDLSRLVVKTKRNNIWSLYLIDKEVRPFLEDEQDITVAYRSPDLNRIVVKTKTGENRSLYFISDFTESAAQVRPLEVEATAVEFVSYDSRTDRYYLVITNDQHTSLRVFDKDGTNTLQFNTARVMDQATPHLLKLAPDRSAVLWEGKSTNGWHLFRNNQELAIEAKDDRIGPIYTDDDLRKVLLAVADNGAGESELLLNGTRLYARKETIPSSSIRVDRNVQYFALILEPKKSGNPVELFYFTPADGPKLVQNLDSAKIIRLTVDGFDIDYVRNGISHRITAEPDLQVAPSLEQSPISA